ncbi:excinuclease ABC subunit UvrA [uncultured Secundilactobacillus sp.]|uniref:excinuclease ABC subunit UvrA n=1 Tax=uncultured Secundilactobacillus sp. TaxID=2813935 RepID=UPI00258426AE|nr:excinuclease ABC subunit UvrA [uncultured Secundilactobacillus sp.]
MAKSHATIPVQIEVHDAYVHNLKHINVKIPLNEVVAISGLSGSGKSSLALGVLYAEGSRRYLDALSTYTRRRISQAAPAQVQEVKYLPAAIALRQRPTVPGVRSTVGTMTETLNVLRLMFSRLSTHVCPNGHTVPPTIEIAQAMDYTDERMGKIKCPTCGIEFKVPAAEDFAFNAAGACPTCGGTGEVRQIDPTTLIDHPEKSLADGAVASWRLPGRNFMPYVIEQMGVRIDVPYQDLSESEKNRVLHGEKKQYKISIPSSTGRVFNMDHALYENAYNAVADTAKGSTNERTLKRLDRFYAIDVCPDCHGSRFNPALFTNTINGRNIAEVSELTVEQLAAFVATIVPALPENMRAMAQRIIEELTQTLRPLLRLGLNYLTIARAGGTLSTGELQRIQLTKTLHSETTGVLYVLDEPSVGLHPANVDGLIEIMHQLVELGNSVVVVEHDPTIIAAADSVIEIGPGAGKAGGQVITQGSVETIEHDAHSLIGRYLTGKAPIQLHEASTPAALFKKGELALHVTHKFNLNDVHVRFPINRLSVVSGFSGAGKTTLVLQSLIPAIKAQRGKHPLPKHVDQLENHHIRRVQMINSVPVGKNVRSTVATYSGIFDHIRELFAATADAQAKGFTASRFSYNLKGGACPTCGGTGVINLDIQYLPDMAETCPTCHGRRYNPETLAVKWQGYNIADVLDLGVTEAIPVFEAEPAIGDVLKTLDEMGLGYLTLGEDTPALSGGEAQRLKLVTQMGRQQRGTLFVFDEPSVGLHPDDVAVLLRVFDRLLRQGATIITIEHDLQLVANADYCVDLGPKGGDQGGQLLVAGSVTDLANSEKSITGRYLKPLLH